MSPLYVFWFTFFIGYSIFFLRFLQCVCNWPYGCPAGKLIINGIIIIIIIIIIKFQLFQTCFQSYKFKNTVNITNQISGTKFIIFLYTWDLYFMGECFSVLFLEVAACTLNYRSHIQGGARNVISWIVHITHFYYYKIIWHLVQN